MKKAHFTIRLGILAVCFPLPACAPIAYESEPYGAAPYAAAPYSERGIAPGYVGVFENGRLVERSSQELQIQEQNAYNREHAPAPKPRKARRTVQQDAAAKRRAAEEERLLEESRRKAQRRNALDYLKY